ncbi:hypothetical protein L210DRAFT_3653059 [Boletus edulis BED1]|uniref:Uncharacterized protein n=1 Tax=Boletus edulis BED1 TaxID=1328754 RepID=A0AAD4BFG2_BOLED|nr:hypothetical protein L210DRAFT_3653059 [Boletus edulis BED1]
MNYDLEAGLQEVVSQIEEFEKRKNKRNRARSERRSKKRALEAEEQGIQTKRWKHRKFMVETQAFTSTDAQAEDLKAAEGGWVGSQKKTGSRSENNVQQLLERGFKLAKWDGKTPHAILDKSERVAAVLAGMPSGSFQQEVVEVAALAFLAGKQE